MTFSSRTHHYNDKFIRIFFVLFVAIPYTIHVMAGPHPTGNPAPYLQLVLCGQRGQAPPISLEQLGSRPPSGSTETYSVESLELGPLHAVRLRLLGGASDTRWHVNKITVHSPTSGHTHHFLCGHGLVSGEECVLEVMDVLGSSVNTTTTTRSSPRPPASQLTGRSVGYYRLVRYRCSYTMRSMLQPGLGLGHS